jgi:hypothetical protein
MEAGGSVTVAETAAILSIVPEQVRRLADNGAITMTGRGQFDRSSVDRHLASTRANRIRAERLAWGAIALLCDERIGWLDPVQISTMRGAVRRMTPNHVVHLTRSRASVHTFNAPEDVSPQLRQRLACADPRVAGLAVPKTDVGVDGYLSLAALPEVVSSYPLTEATRGKHILRATVFDMRVVDQLVGSKVVAALDATGAIDPAKRSDGSRVLSRILDEFRRSRA